MPKTYQELINQIERDIPILNEIIKKGIEELRNYFENYKEEEYNESVNETEEESIKRVESIYDRLDEMIKRNEITNTKVKEVIKTTKEMKKIFGKIIKNIEREKKELVIRNNDLIDVMIDLEERKSNKLILRNPKRKNEITGIFEDKKSELNELRINKKTFKRSLKNKTVVELDEIQQIEEWTGMKIGNVIFDSDIDDWKKGSSVFDERVLNKSNLIFIIEDDDGNKFGGYINAKIDAMDKYLTDPNAFLFSLKSNGRLDGMLKFEIVDSESAFGLCSKQRSGLFVFGHDSGLPSADICIRKRKTTNSHCFQISYEYEGIENPFCGKVYPERFITTKIIVIQMI